jgi:hypothetical protein
VETQLQGPLRGRQDILAMERQKPKTRRRKGMPVVFPVYVMGASDLGL